MRARPGRALEYSKMGRRERFSFWKNASLTDARVDYHVPCRGTGGLHAMLTRFAATMAVALPLVCFAADFAPSGTQGTLTLRISAEGGARHKAPPGAGLDARERRVKNAAQIGIRLRAMDPTGDAFAENQDKAGAARDAFGQSDFAQILTLAGPVGSACSPQIGGKHAVTTELLQHDFGEPVPLNVTIEWRFSAGGR